MEPEPRSLLVPRTSVRSFFEQQTLDMIDIARYAGHVGKMAVAFLKRFCTREVFDWLLIAAVFALYFYL